MYKILIKIKFHINKINSCSCILLACFLILYY